MSHKAELNVRPRHVHFRGPIGQPGPEIVQIALNNSNPYSIAYKLQDTTEYGDLSFSKANSDETSALKLICIFDQNNINQTSSQSISGEAYHNPTPISWESASFASVGSVTSLRRARTKVLFDRLQTDNIQALLEQRLQEKFAKDNCRKLTNPVEMLKKQQSSNMVSSNSSSSGTKIAMVPNSSQTKFQNAKEQSKAKTQIPTIAVSPMKQTNQSKVQPSGQSSSAESKPLSKSSVVSLTQKVTAPKANTGSTPSNTKLITVQAPTVPAPTVPVPVQSSTSTPKSVGNSSSTTSDGDVPKPKGRRCYLGRLLKKYPVEIGSFIAVCTSLGLFAYMRFHRH
ncbi:hypothetical protein RDWZM_006508 [Blomia tropicalis]|uniref:Uncharacterized protein n=1 Tax=Blomia tropicalis TaxID=40697 RepID=A0A9Q0M788_BLOTA|nr:hypothetical protein RDWZM_006508 [Blomia tropicalis]